jgi:starvation-inducible DNA-binding protein
MNTVKSSLSDSARATTGEALQGALIDLIDLSLVGKQAHWNIVGPRFRSVHLQLDEVVALTRGFADAVAERAAAIGVSPDGRAATVASDSGVPAFPSGYVADTDVVGAFVASLESAAKRMRDRIDATAEPDPVTQDLLLGVTAELEKQSWMFQAEHG